MISQLVDGEWVHLTDEEHAAQILAEAAANGIDLCPRCFYGNRVNGECAMCARDAVFNADPDYREWSDAQARLDEGGWAPDSSRPYTSDDAKADEELVNRLERKFAGSEFNAKTEPGGCALCGVPERSHARRWHQQDSSWAYVPPSIVLRKARMVARRNVRLGRPAWAPLNLGGAA